MRRTRTCNTGNSYRMEHSGERAFSTNGTAGLMSTTLTSPSFPLQQNCSAATDVEARLTQCFDAAADDPENDVQLRRAAADYAKAAREQGLSPEKLVIGLKKTLCCHGDFTAVPSLHEEWLDGRVAFGYTKYARVLRWCIQAYYE